MTVTTPKVKGQRREHILQVLASMLETNPGVRITTAELAKAVGVSEAALYRHFPSKARMFEGLIEFIEETLFSRITRILAEPDSAGTGALFRPSVLRRYAEEAGYADVNVAPIEHDFMRFYVLRP